MKRPQRRFALLMLIGIIVIFAILAYTAGWWLPWLLSFVSDNTDFIQGFADLVQLVLWAFAGLSFLVTLLMGLWRGKKKAQPESPVIQYESMLTQNSEAKAYDAEAEERNRILRIRNKFPRTDRRFETDEPQKIIIEFTNVGDDIIHIDGIRYFGMQTLPSSMLSASYSEDNYHRVIDTTRIDVLPKRKFAVEIVLEATFKREFIHANWGGLGFLFIDATYSGESARLQYDV